MTTCAYLQLCATCEYRELCVNVDAYREPCQHGAHKPDDGCCDIPDGEGCYCPPASRAECEDRKEAQP